MKKLLEENETLTQIVNRTDGFHQSITQNVLGKIWLIKTELPPKHSISVATTTKQLSFSVICPII